jgi:hypothetical protein
LLCPFAVFLESIWIDRWFRLCESVEEVASRYFRLF